MDIYPPLRHGEKIVSTGKTALPPWLAKPQEGSYYSNNILKTRNKISP